MPWSADRIPIAVEPLPGEALESWISAYARRLRTTNGGFLETVGLTGVRLHQMALRLNDAEAVALHRATGVPLSVLTAMTLEPFDGLALTILRDRRRLGSRSPAWRLSGGSRSRYCPACLQAASGRGPVLWRLPWVFACPTHQSLLLDVCPACQHPPRPWNTRRLGPAEGGTCTRRSPAIPAGQTGPGIPCGYHLGQAPVIALPSTGLVLTAQQHVTDLLTGEPHSHPAARAELQQLHALAWRMLLALRSNMNRAPDIVRTVLAECGTRPRELSEIDVGQDAHGAALGTALANIARRPGHRDGEALFAWALDTERSLMTAPDVKIGHLAERWVPAGPELVGRALTRLDAEASLHARLRYSSAAPRPRWPSLQAEAIERRAVMTPAMLWPGWTMRLLPPVRTERNQGVDAFRRGCSTFLLLPGGPSKLNYERVAVLLGNHQIERDRSSVERRHYQSQDLTPLASTLAQLAYALDSYGSPINYERRRALFTDATITFDTDAYTQICLRHGWRTGQRGRLRLLRWYLLRLLTGESPPAPADATQEFAARCNDLRFHLPPPLRAFLLAQARSHLTRHSIDEPVSWEPPTSWVSDVTWPGIGPDQIAPDAFREVLADSRTIDDACATLAISREHVRLCCDSTGITAVAPSTAIGKNSVRDAATRSFLLAPERLRDLYERQGLHLREIARMTGCSSATAGTMLVQIGVPLRGRQPLPPRPDITRGWLHREYVQEQRALTSLARERGVTLHHLTTMAKNWGFPIRSTSRRYNAIGHLDFPRPLSAAMRAVVMTPFALDRLRVITQIPGHETVAAAARAFYNGRSGPLRQRIRGIESAAGFIIIDRTVSPLAPTKRGQEFLHEAVGILRIVDANRQAG
ncbi:TniQ family protein [Streptomyces canus]|uniref:TniQ family protein n=1 Tax=Streptomyces canus TaxID=58343 RepID=UPI003722382D